MRTRALGRGLRSFRLRTRRSRGPETRTRQTSAETADPQPARPETSWSCEGWSPTGSVSGEDGLVGEIDEVIGGFALSHEQVPSVQKGHLPEIVILGHHGAIDTNALLAEQASRFALACCYPG